MSARQIRGACALGAYLLVVGFFWGMLASAMRFDGQRAAILSKLDDDANFLVVRDESPLGRLKVGNVVHWVAEPFRVVWRAERGAGDAGVAE